MNLKVKHQKFVSEVKQLEGQLKDRCEAGSEDPLGYPMVKKEVRKPIRNMKKFYRKGKGVVKEIDFSYDEKYELPHGTLYIQNTEIIAVLTYPVNEKIV